MKLRAGILIVFGVSSMVVSPFTGGWAGFGLGLLAASSGVGILWIDTREG